MRDLDNAAVDGRALDRLGNADQACGRPGLPDLGQSLLFLEIEGDSENGRVGVWMSMYDPDPATEATLRRGTEALEGVLAAEPPAEPAVPADSTGA